jgi:ABC-type phosphate transport system substrate-binding protein
MIRKRLVVLMVMGSLTGLVAAGCGSGASHTTTSNAGSSSTPSSSSGGSSNPAVAQAVTACKASINTAAQLSSSLKARLTGLCDKAASGNVTGVKKIAAEVCTQIVNADVPSSAPKSIKDQALAACKKA